MGALLAIVALCIIAYNLIAGLANISNVVRYCLATNSLSEYWSYFFKHCFHLRALYSSIINLIICTVVFIVLIPVILIRIPLTKNKILGEIEQGIIFDYSEVQSNENINSDFVSNASDFGFGLPKIKMTGIPEEDITNVIHFLKEECLRLGKEYKYEYIMKRVEFPPNKAAVFPLMSYIEDEVYPVYLVYNAKQEHQFRNIYTTLKETRYNSPIYFSYTDLKI